VIARAEEKKYRVDDQSFFAAVLRDYFSINMAEYWGPDEPIGKTPQKDNVLSVRTLEPYLFLLGGFDIESPVRGVVLWCCYIVVCCGVVLSEKE